MSNTTLSTLTSKFILNKKLCTYKDMYAYFHISFPFDPQRADSLLRPKLASAREMIIRSLFSLVLLTTVVQRSD